MVLLVLVDLQVLLDHKVKLERQEFKDQLAPKEFQENTQDKV